MAGAEGGATEHLLPSHALSTGTLATGRYLVKQRSLRAGGIIVEEEVGEAPVRVVVYEQFALVEPKHVETDVEPLNIRAAVAPVVVHVSLVLHEVPPAAMVHGLGVAFKSPVTTAGVYVTPLKSIQPTTSPPQAYPDIVPSAATVGPYPVPLSATHPSQLVLLSALA